MSATPESVQFEKLLAACRVVAAAVGFAIPASLTWRAADRGDPLEQIAAAAGVRTRQVMLRPAWQRHDNGPLLGYRSADRTPVALLPRGATGYLLVQEGEAPERVTEAVAATLGVTAVMFYRPFPARPLTVLDLLRYSARAPGADLRTLLLASVAGGVLAGALPIAMSLLIGRIVPAGVADAITQLGAGLVASAAAAAALAICQGIALLRLQTRTDAELQAALWDRLLRLPAPFFRQFTAGDLGERALGISAFREAVAATLLTLLLGGMTALVAAVLLCALLGWRAFGAVGVAVVLVGGLVWFGLRELHWRRAEQALRGETAGLTLELIDGIVPIRASGAEQRAFGRWAERLVAQQAQAYNAARVAAGGAVWGAVVPVGALLLTLLLAGSAGSVLALGSFVAAVAALTQLLQASATIGGGITKFVGALPLLERARPILATVPEALGPAAANPGILRGAIELCDVTFRYGTGPAVLAGVSIAIAPGERVAIVGPSGSGKSTLVRLLIGFERPERGAVLYDGQDLATLDLGAVRRQIGTVLQDAQLMAGDILRNIGGAQRLTPAEAWEAARLAGLEAELRQFPMGMQTPLFEGGATLSGGQRQRLLIARALARRPRVLLLDEATSALDALTQAAVSETLAQLPVTQITIAHRLSTVANADRIIVLEAGRVVQSGTYAALLAEPGLFAQLAQRQLAEER